MRVLLLLSYLSSLNCQVYIIPKPTTANPTTDLEIYTFNYKETRNKAYIIRSTEDWHVYSDDNLAKTSQQGLQHSCKFVSNAGPFHPDGSPVGLVVSDGKTINSASNNPSVGFGSSNDSYTIGRINEKDVEKYKIDTFVTGFDWLVIDGENAADRYNNTTGADRAPRTAIGLKSNGVMILVVTDGCERCIKNRGLTLHELGDLLVEFGAEYAINMDGGSSSVLVEYTRESLKTSNTNVITTTTKTDVVSHPTCLDVLPIKCERRVATILCCKDHSATTRNE